MEYGLDMQLFMATLYLWVYFVHRKLLHHHHHHGCCSVGLLGSISMKCWSRIWFLF